MDNETIGSEGIQSRQAVMLVALGLVLLALVYFLFFRGGGGGEQELAPTSPDPVAQAESSNEDPFEPDGGDASNAPVETFEVFASRDPFEPIVEGGAQGAGAESNQEEQGSGGPDAQGQGQDENDPAPTTGPAAPQSQEEEVEGHTVNLIDVFREGGKDKAQVQVDSTGYTVTVDEVFAENFQLVSTSGQCATFLYGDDQFTLCEGEQILK